jgi:hypothetical protein
MDMYCWILLIALFLVVLLLIIGFTMDLFDKFCHWILPKKYEDKSSALQPIIFLFVFILTQIIAAVIIEHGKGIRKIHILYYSMLCFFCLAIIFVISRVRKARQGSNEHNIYCYDRGTFWAGKCIILICTLLLAAFVFFGWNGKLPGQGLLPLRISDIQIADNVTANIIPGLKYDVYLNGRQFLWGMPSTIVLDVTFDEKTQNAWQLVTVDIKEFWPNGTMMPALAESKIQRDKDQKKLVKTVLRGLLDDTTYQVTLYFEPVGSDFDTDKKELLNIQKKDMPEEQKKNWIKRLKDKYFAQAEEARLDINLNGRIGITLDP